MENIIKYHRMLNMLGSDVKHIVNQIDAVQLKGSPFFGKYAAYFEPLDKTAWRPRESIIGAADVRFRTIVI